MKTVLRITLLLFTGSFLLTLISVSYSDEWEIYSKGYGGICYYDKENVTHMPNNVVRVWDKQIFSDAGKKEAIKKLGDSFKDLEYSIALLQINCNEKKYNVLSLSFYDSKQNIIYSQKTSGEEEFILPDSIMEELHKSVCKKTI
jgi:hypothetical protein